MSDMQFQKALQAQFEVAAARPRAFQIAQRAVSAWGKQEKLLLQAIADAVTEAHELGLAGKELPDVDRSLFGRGAVEEPDEQAPVAPRVARTRPAPAPPQVARVPRRTR